MDTPMSIRPLPRLLLALTLASPACTQAAAEKLLLASVNVSPDAAEAIEIHNPGGQAIALGQYYLADFETYYNVKLGTIQAGGDFVVRFPSVSIPAGASRIVALRGATAFQTQFGRAPDFEMLIFGSPDNLAVPNMVEPYLGSVGITAGLTNAGEPVVLFHWDGASNLVTDVDYIFYGADTVTNPPVDKTGVVVNGSTYQPDTADADSRHAPLGTGAVVITCRTDFAETGQTATGSNGIGGRDETSENASVTWTGCTVPPYLRTVFTDGFED